MYNSVQVHVHRKSLMLSLDHLIITTDMTDMCRTHTQYTHAYTHVHARTRTRTSPMLP